MPKKWIISPEEAARFRALKEKVTRNGQIDSTGLAHLIFERAPRKPQQTSLIERKA